MTPRAFHRSLGSLNLRAISFVRLWHDNVYKKTTETSSARRIVRDPSKTANFRPAGTPSCGPPVRTCDTANFDPRMPRPIEW